MNPAFAAFIRQMNNIVNDSKAHQVIFQDNEREIVDVKNASTFLALNKKQQRIAYQTHADFMRITGNKNG